MGGNSEEKNVDFVDVITEEKSDVKTVARNTE